MLAGLLFVLPGCAGGDQGPKKFKVAGTVKVDGAPLPDGYVMFEAEDGQTASAAGKVRDGAYSFESLPGPKKVIITASRPTGRTEEEDNPGAGAIPIMEQYLPEKYSASHASTLAAEVKESHDNRFDFDLSTK